MHVVFVFRGRGGGVYDGALLLVSKCEYFRGLEAHSSPGPGTFERLCGIERPFLHSEEAFVVFFSQQNNSLDLFSSLFATLVLVTVH